MENKAAQYFYCTRLELLDELEREGFTAVVEREGRFFPGQRVWLFELSPELQRAAKEYYDRIGQPYPRSLRIEAPTPGGGQNSVSDQMSNGARGLFCSKNSVNRNKSELEQGAKE